MTKCRSVWRPDGAEVRASAPNDLVPGNFRNNKNFVNPTSAMENKVAKEET